MKKTLPVVRVCLWAFSLMVSCASGACAAPAAPTKAASSASAKTPLLVAQDGKSLLAITISSAASADTRSVAAELAVYLKRITGGEFEVREGDGSEGIVLGTLAQFPNAALKAPLAIRDH